MKLLHGDLAYLPGRGLYKSKMTNENKLKPLQWQPRQITQLPPIDAADDATIQFMTPPKIVRAREAHESAVQENEKAAAHLRARASMLRNWYHYRHERLGQSVCAEGV